MCCSSLSFPTFFLLLKTTHTKEKRKSSSHDIFILQCDFHWGNNFQPSKLIMGFVVLAIWVYFFWLCHRRQEWRLQANVLNALDKPAPKPHLFFPLLMQIDMDNLEDYPKLMSFKKKFSLASKKIFFKKTRTQFCWSCLRLAVFLPCYTQAIKDVKRAHEVRVGGDGIERRE